ncbi:hypothetical protein SOVF_105900 isoform B [Spinacia oleracea]|nr:hypothetical protein SOVF_105900 isoform B [Spinacia oleracea]
MGSKTFLTHCTPSDSPHSHFVFFLPGAELDGLYGAAGTVEMVEGLLTLKPINFSFLQTPASLLCNFPLNPSKTRNNPLIYTPLLENTEEKLSQFFHAPAEILNVHDVPNIWHVPLLLQVGLFFMSKKCQTGFTCSLLFRTKTICLGKCCCTACMATHSDILVCVLYYIIKRPTWL